LGKLQVYIVGERVGLHSVTTRWVNSASSSKSKKMVHLKTRGKNGICTLLSRQLSHFILCNTSSFHCGDALSAQVNRARINGVVFIPANNVSGIMSRPLYF
jgi:hypothetical protein